MCRQGRERQEIKQWFVQCEHYRVEREKRGKEKKIPFIQFYVSERN